MLSLASAIRQEKKRHKDGKEEIKSSLFTEDMIIYTESNKELTKKTLLELMSKLYEVAGCELNIQKRINCVSI